MIRSTKSARFAGWFARDAETRIAKTFSRVRIRGLAGLRAAIDAGPVLVVSNHTAWWDPLVALVLSQRVLEADSYALMDAKNLARLPFFGKVGAFGVDLDDPRDGARAIRYATKLLLAAPEARRLVWIFAQGREVPITRRPLGFRRGGGEIAKLARGARVVPVALRYEMGSEPEPALWIAIGQPSSRPISDAREEHARQESAVTEELDRIERGIADDPGDFEVLLAKRPSRVFAILQAILVWWTRPRSLPHET